MTQSQPTSYDEVPYESHPFRMKPIIILLVIGSTLWLGLLAYSWLIDGTGSPALKPPLVPIQSERKRPDPPKELTADETAVVEGNNQFALDLYARLSEKVNGNVIFSPYSISDALAMTYAGARGETAEQMAKVLHFTLEQERLHLAFGGLMNDLGMDYPDRPYQLYIANRLWVQEKLGLVDEFVQFNRKVYRAGLKEVDFIGQTEEARQAIDKWVEEKTKDKVKELLLPGDVDIETRLVLSNAIYFKATWKMRFPKDQTKNAPFEVTLNEKRLVPMMSHKENNFRYFEDDVFQWLELPYLGDRLSMVMLLPLEKGQLSDLEKTLTAVALQQGIAKLGARKGSVFLPRFKMTLRLSLKEDFERLGMPLAFSRDADFSGITPEQRLQISGVFHKAYIDVNEEGTEAAAATAVVMRANSLVYPFLFRADHPFLFLIRDQHSGSILFLGRVSDPRL